MVKGKLASKWGHSPPPSLTPCSPQRMLPLAAEEISPHQALTYLWADLSRNGGKLWVGGKGGQVVHGLNEGGSGLAAALPVLWGESPVQSLQGRTEGRAALALGLPPHGLSPRPKRTWGCQGGLPTPAAPPGTGSPELPMSKARQFGLGWRGRRTSPWVESFSSSQRRPSPESAFCQMPNTSGIAQPAAPFLAGQSTGAATEMSLL